MSGTTINDGLSFAFWPWERNEPPYFINEEGFEWYIDKSLTDHATSKNGVGEPLKAVCFLVAKDKKAQTRILVDIYNNVLSENTSLEDMACKIDMLRLSQKLT